MQPHPVREMFADHSCKNCRYPERGCARYMRLNTCQEFQPNDDAIFREIVRLKIAHLRRMVESIRFVLDRHLIRQRVGEVVQRALGLVADPVARVGGEEVQRVARSSASRSRTCGGWRIRRP